MMIHVHQFARGVPIEEPSAEKLALVGDDHGTCDGDSHNTRPRRCPVRGR